MNAELLIVALVVFLWLLAAWNALAELSGGRIRRIESEDRKLASRLEKWQEKQTECELVFRLLTFSALALTAVAFRHLFMEYALIFSFDVHALFSTVLAVLVLGIVGESLVRLVLIRYDIAVLRFSMPVVLFLSSTLFMPLIWLLDRISHGGSGNENNGEKPTAEDEIMSLVEHNDDDDEESSLEEDEKRMIKGIFDLDYTPVREIMTPRVDMVALPASGTVQEAKKLIVESGHSRIPVYGESIDEIKGIIYAKDFLDDSRQGRHAEDFMHKVLYVPESKNVGDLLDEFKFKGLHVAIIIDEYGGTSGMVTLEDILEEIVGDIRDEYDDDTDLEPEPVTMPDGSIVFEGRCLISDVNELMDTDISEDEDVDTIGGYVCAQFGYIPEAGEEINLGDHLKAQVMKADKRKILSVKLSAIEED